MDKKQIRNFTFTWNYQEQPSKEEVIELFSPLDYVYLICSIEKAKTGQLHLQGYCELQGQKTFKTIQKTLKSIHFEPRKGSQKQAIEYVIKTGTKYEDGTTVQSKYVEDGEPKRQAEASRRTDIEEFVEAIRDGASNIDLLNNYPRQYFLYQNKIQTIRNTVLEEKYSRVFRKLDITYIYGEAGSGKSKMVFEKYPSAYKVSSYHSGAFDGYQNEDVIVLEEFRGNFTLSFLLQLLDGYPLRLPARYIDKQACYTKVYIISNIPLEEQYPNIDEKSLDALYRRINKIQYMKVEINENQIVEDAIKFLGSDIVNVKSSY